MRACVSNILDYLLLYAYEFKNKNNDNENNNNDNDDDNDDIDCFGDNLMIFQNTHTIVLLLF